MSNNETFSKITCESDIYNAIAQFLIELIESNYNVDEFVTIDRKQIIDDYVIRFSKLLLIKKIADRVNALDKMYQEVKNKDLFHKLCFLMAYDLKKHDTSIYIMDSKHIVLNTFYTDLIEIYPIFSRKINHIKTYNISLSSLFQNLSYCYKPGLKLKVRNVYLPNLVGDDVSSLKVGFMPFSAKYYQKIKKEKNHDEILITPITANNLLTSEEKEYFIAELKFLINAGVNFIICPETLPDLFADKAFAKEVRELINQSETILFGPSAYIENKDGKIINRAILLNKYLEEDVIIKKFNPYMEKGSRLEMRGRENITIGDTITVIHMKNFGSIMLLICSDYFHEDVGKLIKMLNVDVIAISAATTSYNQFNAEHSGLLNENRLLFQCNLCYLCFKNKEMNIAPINFYAKGITENQIMDRYKCSNKECSRCVKHFIVDVKIVSEIECSVEMGESDERK